MNYKHKALIRKIQLYKLGYNKPKELNILEELDTLSDREVSLVDKSLGLIYYMDKSSNNIMAFDVKEKVLFISIDFISKFNMSDKSNFKVKELIKWYIKNNSKYNFSDIKKVISWRFVKI